jgi:hypothetical protein
VPDCIVDAQFANDGETVIKVLHDLELQQEQKNSEPVKAVIPDHKGRHEHDQTGDDQCRPQGFENVDDQGGEGSDHSA